MAFRVINYWDMVQAPALWQLGSNKIPEMHEMAAPKSCVGHCLERVR